MSNWSAMSLFLSRARRNGDRKTWSTGSDTLTHGIAEMWTGLSFPVERYVPRMILRLLPKLVSGTLARAQCTWGHHVCIFRTSLTRCALFPVFAFSVKYRDCAGQFVMDCRPFQSILMDGRACLLVQNFRMDCRFSQKVKRWPMEPRSPHLPKLQLRYTRAVLEFVMDARRSVNVKLAGSSQLQKLQSFVQQSLMGPLLASRRQYSGLSSARLKSSGIWIHLGDDLRTAAQPALKQTFGQNWEPIGVTLLIGADQSRLEWFQRIFAHRMPG